MKRTSIFEYAIDELQECANYIADEYPSTSTHSLTSLLWSISRLSVDQITELNQYVEEKYGIENQSQKTVS